jgi:hypothetical protein
MRQAHNLSSMRGWILLGLLGAAKTMHYHIMFSFVIINNKATNTVQHHITFLNGLWPCTLLTITACHMSDLSPTFQFDRQFIKKVSLQEAHWAKVKLPVIESSSNRPNRVGALNPFICGWKQIQFLKSHTR